MSQREPALDERVLLVYRAFTDTSFPFAFGGAIALTYHGEPRATVDIDLNVFVAVERAPDVLAVAVELGAEVTEQRRQFLVDQGQVRLRWGRYPLDLFLSTHPFHDSCADRVQRVPFADEEIPILSAEDLTLFKILFDRPKDWFDIEQVLFAQAGQFDVGYVEHWLDRLIGSSDERVSRFHQALRTASGT